MVDAQQVFNQGAAMELKRAKELISSMGLALFSENALVSYHTTNYVLVFNSDFAALDGEFSHDQLEAIATWMRDPEGVVKA